MYCPFNSFCVDVNCRGNHYHNFEQRKQLAEILKSYPEHIMLIDGFKPQRGKKIAKEIEEKKTNITDWNDM